MGSLHPLRTTRPLPIPWLTHLRPDRLSHWPDVGILSRPLCAKTLPSSGKVIPLRCNDHADWSTISGHSGADRRAAGRTPREEFHGYHFGEDGKA